MASQYLIKFSTETGERLITYPYDKTITEDRKDELIEDGFEIVPEPAFQLLIGNVDGYEYVKNLDGEGYIRKPPYIPPLDEAKANKLNQLKNARDAAEVEPIESGGYLYDYDEKARDRINAAIIALDLMGDGATIEWTMANNINASVTANDLRAMIGAVAIRSNELHVKYRRLKDIVNAAETYEKVQAITWDMIIPTESEPEEE